MWQGGGEEGERERETHSLTHRVKDWDLVMYVAGRRGGGEEGRRGGGREGTRDTLTHSQGQGLGPSDVCGREEGRRERGNKRDTLTHSQGQGLSPIVYFSSVGRSTHINNFLILHAVDMVPLCRSASCHRQDGCTDEEVKGELKVHHTATWSHFNT